MSSASWSYELIEEADARFRVDVTDEDGALLPIARQLTRGQAEKLIQRITSEATRERKPIKAIIRDPFFMAATVITIKRQAI
ncbi:MAG TPA: hypothetical protein VFG86_04215 [Chloroflexota bacterium]|nr:hypothetical protein [Chloroflexota bacterium]